MPLRGPGLVPVRPLFPVITKTLCHISPSLSPTGCADQCLCALGRPVMRNASLGLSLLPLPTHHATSPPMARAYTLTFSDPDPCS